jgi:hypothetical protein
VTLVIDCQSRLSSHDVGVNSIETIEQRFVGMVTHAMTLQSNAVDGSNHRKLDSPKTHRIPRRCKSVLKRRKWSAPQPPGPVPSEF